MWNEEYTIKLPEDKQAVGWASVDRAELDVGPP